MASFIDTLTPENTHRRGRIAVQQVYSLTRVDLTGNFDEIIHKCSRKKLLLYDIIYSRAESIKLHWSIKKVEKFMLKIERYLKLNYVRLCNAMA